VNIQQPPPQVVIEQAPPQVQIQPAVPPTPAPAPEPAPAPAPQAAAPPPPPEPVPVTPPSPAGVAVEQMIGRPVVNAQGEEIGQVRDLLMSPDGVVDRAIVDVGGFLGVATKQIAVPWDQVSVQPDGDRITLPMDRQQLETAPDHEYAEGDNALVGPTR
jgi:sporulation protein YlmC with PRC-barrel domain